MTHVEGDGFTLVEVIVVLMVLGIVMAVVKPPLPDFGSSSRSERIESVLDLLQSARREAAKRGQPVVLQFNQDMTTYELRVEVGESDDHDAMLDGPERTTSDVLEGGRVPVRVRMEPVGPKYEFRFHPTGRAHGPILSVETVTGQNVRIRVNPWTGRPRVSS